MTAPTQTVSPPPTPQPAANVAKQVLRNRYGQRIDPIVSYDPNEVKRIKKLKMCNVRKLILEICVVAISDRMPLLPANLRSILC